MFLDPGRISKYLGKRATMETQYKKEKTGTEPANQWSSCYEAITPFRPPYGVVVVFLIYFWISHYSAPKFWHLNISIALLKAMVKKPAQCIICVFTLFSHINKHLKTVQMNQWWNLQRPQRSSWATEQRYWTHIHFWTLPEFVISCGL